MSIQDQLTSLLARRSFARMARLPCERLARHSEQLALAAFQRAAREVPAYRAILARAGVHAADVRTRASFERLVPICGKERLFGAHAISTLCKSGQLWSRASAFASSGYSGAFSFGLETPRDVARTRLAVDALLDRYFGVVSRRTLLVNLLPNVRVPSRYVLAADVGAHIAAALAVIARLGGESEQLVLVGEPLVLKELVESGAEAGIDWGRYRVHAVTGGELLPENLRTYLGTRLEHEREHPERGQILASFGVSEIALSLAHETPELRRVRQALADAPDAAERAFGVPFLPGLLAYFPTLHYLETPSVSGRSRLVVTTLDPDRTIPLIRYDTGDFARALSAKELAEALARLGHAELAPVSQLPVLASFGRGSALTVGDSEIFPEQIKEALYADAGVANAATGRFVLERAGHGGARVRAQLKRGRGATPALCAGFGHWLLRYARVPIDVVWESYTAFEPETLINTPGKVRGL